MSTKRPRKEKANSSKETPKELISNSSKETPKELTSNSSKETPEEVIPNSSKERPEEVTPNSSKETSEEVIPNSSKETPEEVISNSSKEAPTAPFSSSSKATPKELISKPIRSSKRPRKEKGNSSKETPKASRKTKSSTFRPPKIAFGSESQEERYTSLKTRTICPTVCWDEDTVQTLGFEEDVDYMFTNIGWKSFVQMKFPVYEAITLEFLSSLAVKDLNRKDEDEGVVSFRLFNTDHSLDFATLNSIFGFPVGGDRSQKPYGFIAQHVWGVIGGCGSFVASSSKVSQIGHPLAKLLQRFMSHTIFGREESQQHVRSTELVCLWAMLTPGVRIDCGVHMIRHFLQRATQGNGDILFGGLITPIAMHVHHSNELHCYKPKSEVVPTFTIAYCIIKNVICKSRLDGYYSVLADDGRIFRLPDPKRSLRGCWSFNGNTESSSPPPSITMLHSHLPSLHPPFEQATLNRIYATIHTLLNEFREHRTQFQAHQATFLAHTMNFQAHQEEFRNFQAEIRSHWHYPSPIPLRQFPPPQSPK